MVQVSKSIAFSLVKVGKKLIEALKRCPANDILLAVDKNNLPLLGKNELEYSNIQWCLPGNKNVASLL